MIKIEEFVRKFSVIGEKQFSLLLGAGASASSNVPTASEMTWDFKRRLYATKKGFKISEVENRDFELRQEIENWTRTEYKDRPDNEYSYFFELTFPSNSDRRRYIHQSLKSANPSIGYRILRFLIDQKLIWHFITTNFDNLIQKVFPDIIEISEENIRSQKTKVNVNSELPIVAKLHGDFRYDSLQNTNRETQELNHEVMSSIQELFKSTGLIVIGYSGRDESVMSFLEDFVEENPNPFPQGFFWCVTSENPNKRVLGLITQLKNKNIEADIVQISNFDDLLISSYNQLSVKDKEIDSYLKMHQKIQPFVSPEKYKNSFIVLNALRITDYPQTFLTFKTNNVDDWETLDEITKNKNVFASFFKDGKKIALGEVEEVKNTFNEFLPKDPEFERYTTTEKDLQKLNKQRGFLLGIYYNIFDWHFRNNLGLENKGKRLFYINKIHKKTQHPNLSELKYYKAFKYSIEYRNNNLIFLLRPYYLCEDFLSLSREDYAIRQNALISSIWNKEVLEDLAYWIKILKNGLREVIKIEFPANKLCFCLTPKFYKSGEATSD